MSDLAVDASVAVKWFLPEEHSDEARALLASEHTLIAPDLIIVETADVFWKNVRRGALTPEKAEEGLDLLFRVPIGLTPSPRLTQAALRIAIETDRSVYDCLYLALANASGCRLVTADTRIYAYDVSVLDPLA